MRSDDRPDQDRPALVLFRSDLRLRDNLALNAAVVSGRPIIPVFVRDDGVGGIRALGAARRWWLHHSLTALARQLADKGQRLIFRSGEMGAVVQTLVEETGAGLVVWNRRYDPPASAADAGMKLTLRKAGIEAHSFDGQLLHEPSQLRTGSGGAYKVYTPFWRARASSGEPREPIPAPDALRPPERLPASEDLQTWRLLPTGPDWSQGLREAWTPGEAGAHDNLDAFLENGSLGYAERRDLPAAGNTSRLSPHLAHGEITPFQLWHAVSHRKSVASAGDIEKFRKELAWREFSYHLLAQNPELARRNHTPSFDAFPWRDDPGVLAAWQNGQTGYPIVDAGMRQLWQTGWMHNRVRLVTASFLVKHLLIDWRQGEDWFWDTLVDADPANNAANWQWVAGSGADAAPYFRIFNPVLQGEKFDPNGRYVREFVPELANFPARVLHRPWRASESEFSSAGVKLGETYPVPVVDHDQARRLALDAYRSTRGE